MKTYFTMLIVAAVAAFLATPVVQRLALQLNAVDRPDPRKIHSEPTPRLGGLAVLFGFCVPWALLYAVDNRVAAVFTQHETMIFTLMLGGIGIFAVGMFDDIHGMRAMSKLLAQLVVASGLYLAGFKITQLSNPFGGVLELGWFSFPLTLLWIVAITNAMNLLDGMDGLVAGVTACMTLSLAFINILSGDVVVALLTFCLAGAVLGFLPHNFSPARIFLGDSGSLFLGLLMACISTLSLFKAATAAVLVVPFVLFALPLYDTASVVIGRLRRGQHIFAADKTHIHHRLLEMGLNQKQTAAVLYSVSVFLGLVSILLTWRPSPGVFLGVGLASLVFGLSLGGWILGVRGRHGGSRTDHA